MTEAYNSMKAMEGKFDDLKKEVKLKLDRVTLLETTLKKEQARNDDLNRFRDVISSVLDRMKKPTESIESTLSCLSCLNFLGEPKPMTLKCGHSICALVSSYKVG